MSIEEEKQYLAKAEASGVLSRLGAYTKLSGPGWLQSAITLGGGSLASSLFLGVLAGVSLLWLQPVAIILGVIMLCAISHVTLSTGQSPFVSINREINPVLGWGWAIATIMANVVWCLPQFNLGTNAVTQNLLPEYEFKTAGKVGICAILLILATTVIWISDRASKGVKIFDWTLRIMVGLIVISFFGVVIKLAGTGQLEWGKIARGFVPDLSLIFEPAEIYGPYLEKTGEFRSYWENKIVGEQRNVMISAAATAVGINMTFFMPFVLLRRGWGREHRGLAKFDLWTALLIPYVVATSCVVIAAGSQFNNKPLSAYKYEDIDSIVTRATSMKPGDRAVYDIRTKKPVILIENVGKGKFAIQEVDQNGTIIDQKKTISAEHLTQRILQPGDSVYNALTKKPGIVVEDLGTGQLKIEEADKNSTITISASHLVERILDPGDLVHNTLTNKPGIVVRNLGEGQVEIADADNNTTMTAKSLHLVKRVLHDNLVEKFDSLISARLANEHEGYENKSKDEKKGILQTVPIVDKYLAAMLVRRDAEQLAASLETLFESKAFSHYVFGFGVLGMALSTIIILMTINGHAICEVLGKPHKGPIFLGGAMIPALGVLGPFMWGEHGFWLAVPTSIIGFTLIPVAYLSFFLLINNRKILGRDMPQGIGRWIWNVTLLIALTIMGSAAFLTAWNKTLAGVPVGRYALIGFGIMLIMGHFHLKHAKLAARVNTLDLKQQKLEKEQE